MSDLHILLRVSKNMSAVCALVYADMATYYAWVGHVLGYCFLIHLLMIRSYDSYLQSWLKLSLMLRGFAIERKKVIL